MAIITLNPDCVLGTIKPMNAVNNGPIKARSDQTRGNYDEYVAAKFPYARNHDAAHSSGPHVVDVNYIFTDFSKDENDPASYDFTITDGLVRVTMNAGTEVFYRLGASIEHWSKKYNTLPPPDFHKWARICEHIIAHYTEGWANGYNYNITYWEIWNEADLDPDDSPNKRCWGGTKAEFFELFKITATHLKKRFPHLKIGGPAIAGNWSWAEDFIREMGAAKVPMDFFSWHKYTVNPKDIAINHEHYRELLDQAGYHNTESHLNEYNYVRGWGEDWIYSIQTMIGLKGAAFTAACMCVGQNCGLDMLMYYDLRPCVMNGVFDFYTLKPLKGYYAFTAFSTLYQMKNHIACQCDDPDVYATAAKDDQGNMAVLISNYNNDDNASYRTVTVSGIKDPVCYLTDETYSAYRFTPPTDENGNVTLKLARNAFVLVRTRE